MEFHAMVKREIKKCLEGWGLVIVVRLAAVHTRVRGLDALTNSMSCSSIQGNYYVKGR